MKKLKKILPCFVALGVTCLVAKGLLTQNTTYQQYLVNPTDNAISQLMVFDEKIQDNKSRKEKYKNWTKENISFLNTIVTNDIDIKEKINTVPVIINDGSTIFEKISINFHQILSKITSRPIDNNVMNIASGRAIQFNEILEETSTENGEVKLERIDFGIYIGIQALEDKNHHYINGLSKFLTEQQKYDYIFLHELSHYLSKEMLGNEKQNEEQLYDMILSSFKKTQETKNFKHSKEDKEIILSQYKESIADVLAVQLLYKKYPELVVLDIPHELAKLRAERIEHDYTHLNIVALKLFEHNPNTDNLEDMLSYAREKALENTQFFSDRSYANDGSNNYKERQQEVKLTEKFETKKHIRTIRSLYNEAHNITTKKTL